MDVIVVRAGPAGVLAALRAAELGARTVLVTRDGFGGMSANDGPVPVRTLAHAARLLREARQLGQYGIAVSEPLLDYPRLLARVREVVDDVRRHSMLREHIDRLGVTLYEQAGTARFVDPHTIESVGNSSTLRQRAPRPRDIISQTRTLERTLEPMPQLVVLCGAVGRRPALSLGSVNPVILPLSPLAQRAGPTSVLEDLTGLHGDCLAPPVLGLGCGHVGPGHLRARSLRVIAHREAQVLV